MVAKLKDAISTALDCDTEGADCTAKLGSLPTCDSRVLSDEFSWPGDHGKDVPVGVVATRQCPKARFVPADRSTVTCQATGWTKVGAECASCPEDCDACSGKETCTQCSRGFDLSFNIAASKYSQVSRNKQTPLATENLLENTDGGRSTPSVFSRSGSLRPSVYADARYILMPSLFQAKLTASNVILDNERPISVNGKEQRYDYNRQQARKACLVDGDTDSQSWNKCPSYDQETCSVSNAPYVTIDLKTKMRVGKVRVYVGRKSPLATKNLLEVTDGLRRPP